jgi:hypothetical protein
MSYVNAGNVRIGFVGLAVAVALTAGFSGEAAAQHGRHAVLRTHGHGQMIQTASVQETARPVMRYYGGPKSPMWSSQ